MVSGTITFEGKVYQAATKLRNVYNDISKANIVISICTKISVKKNSF